MIRALILDFETESSCDLKVAGAWRYAEDPTTDVLCLGYWLDGETERYQWRPDLDGPNMPEPLQRFLADPEILAACFNSGFEKAIWARIMVDVYGWPPLRLTKWHDTQAVCAMLGLPLDLDKSTANLGLQFQKDIEGNKTIKAWNRIDNRTGTFKWRTPAARERIMTYNVADLDAQMGLHRRIGWLPPGERKVWLLNQRVNERGIRLDIPLVKAMQRVVAGATVPLAAEFKEITGGLSFTQRDAVVNWVREQGVDLPNLQKETLAKLLGEDEDDGTLSDDGTSSDGEGIPDLPEGVRRALHIRQLVGSAAIKKLPRMESCVGLDGRVRGTIQYHGTGPGRSSGRLLQPQNFPRGTLTEDGGAPDATRLVQALMSGDWEWVESLYGPAVECVASSLRHTIIADPGRVLVSADYAGIQARVVLALAGEHGKTAIMAAGQDIYCDMAGSIFGRTITKKDKMERQTGKNSVLGLGFQMGWRKFRDKYCPDQPEEFAQRVVDTYREKWAPGVPEVWAALEEAALRTVQTGRPHEGFGIEYRREDRWLTARLPSGRKLWYFNPRPVRKHMPWSTEEKPDIRDAWVFSARKSGGFITIDAFGGQLTENVVMGIERDIMTAGMMRAEKNGFPVVLEVHDEVVTEPVTTDCDEKTLFQILCDVDPWTRMMQVPIAVEGWTSDRYMK